MLTFSHNLLQILLYHFIFWPQNVVVQIALISQIKPANKMSTRGSKYLTSRLFSCFCTVLWVFQSGSGEVHLEMLRVSCLLAAAITSHCISLFYGHKQLWNSPSPFGASFGNISQRFIYNLRARPVPHCGRCVHSEYAMIHPHQVMDFKKRMHCVVACPCVCAKLTCVHFFKNIFFMTTLFDPSNFFFHHL